jgi:hypothetical protein
MLPRTGGSTRTPNTTVSGSDKALNTPHVVTVGAPLLRPGLTISATCSEKYVSEVVRRLMAIVQEVNADLGRGKVT